MMTTTKMLARLTLDLCDVVGQPALVQRLAQRPTANHLHHTMIIITSQVMYYIRSCTTLTPLQLAPYSPITGTSITTVRRPVLTFSEHPSFSGSVKHSDVSTSIPPMLCTGICTHQQHKREHPPQGPSTKTSSTSSALLPPPSPALISNPYIGPGELVGVDPMQQDTSDTRATVKELQPKLSV